LEYYKKKALNQLVHLLFYKDEEVLQDTCWALSYMSEGPSEKIIEIVKLNIGKHVVRLLSHPSTRVQAASLRVIGNIVTGDDAQTQYMISQGVLPKLKELLKSDKKYLVRESCWTISNIAAGNDEQIQAIVNAEIFPRIIELLYSNEYEIIRESVWTITNATTNGSPSQIRHLVENQLLFPFFRLLSYEDPRIVVVVLEGILNILQKGAKEVEGTSGENPYISLMEAVHGHEKLQILQTHKNDDIYQKAVYILELYFQAEEVVDFENFQPNELDFNFSGSLENYKF